MSDVGVPAKLAGFAVLLVVGFGAAFGVGRAVGTSGDAPAPAATTTTTEPVHGGHS